MSRILLLEDDPVFAALLEDHLHLAGHRVDRVSRLERASKADLVILGSPTSAVAVEMVTALRGASETAALPIVVLSETSDSGERFALLRAGADDYLARPVEPEEVVLRVQRLVGSPASGASVPLSGDLVSNPLWELLEFIEQTHKSGELLIQGAGSSSRIQCRGGKVLDAQWEGLNGAEALLAILGTREGSFRFLPRDDREATLAGVTLPARGLLMQAAWLEDELTKRRAHLPATGVPLRTRVEEPPELEVQLQVLPVQEVFHRLAQEPGLRLWDLLAEHGAAPQKVRLAVAWLVEKGAVSVLEEEGQAFPTTSEILTALILEAAAEDLLASTRETETSSMPYLILAEEEALPELEAMLRRLRSADSERDLRRLPEQLRSRGGGSTSLMTARGRLTFYVRLLTPAAQKSVEAIVPVSAGVLLWLHEVRHPEVIQGVMQRLEGVKGAAEGILVAPRPAGRAWAEEVARQSRKWRLSPRPPESLLGVLRLFLGVAAGAKPSEGR